MSPRFTPKARGEPENGDDAFFVTGAQLSTTDNDTSFDVYDAHVCSAAVPCKTAPVSSPPCTSGDSCKAAPSPQPEIFGSPPSATFNGAGNITPASTPVVKSKAKPARCKKGFVRKKHRCVKVKGKHKKRAKKSAKRASNERRARS